MRSRKWWIWVLPLLFAFSLLALAENKGNCPPSPSLSSMKPSQGVNVPPKAPGPDVQYIGAVQLMVVVSDKGYVCDVQVVRKLEKDADAYVTQAVRRWHFDAAKKDGRPIPASAIMKVDVWRNARGEFVLAQPPAGQRHAD